VRLGNISYGITVLIMNMYSGHERTGLALQACKIYCTKQDLKFSCKNHFEFCYTFYVKEWIHISWCSIKHKILYIFIYNTFKISDILLKINDSYIDDLIYQQ